MPNQTWKNWRKRWMGAWMNFLDRTCGRTQFTVTEFRAQIQELQDKANSINDSREFQDVESVCSSRFTHVPTQPVIVSSLCGFPSWDQCERPDTRNFLSTSDFCLGKFICTSWIDNTYFWRGVAWKKSCYYTFWPRFFITRKAVTRSEEVNEDTIPTPIFSWGSSTWNPSSRVYPQNHIGWSSKTPDLGPACRTYSGLKSDLPVRERGRCKEYSLVKNKHGILNGGHRKIVLGGPKEKEARKFFSET